jgi:hypothetical protein
MGKMKESKEIERWQTARGLDKKHAETLERKNQRLDGLKALLLEYEAVAVDDQDRKEMRELKVRIRTLDAQIKAMKP